jgi:nucleoside-diphosphate-sugar epimerase
MRHLLTGVTGFLGAALALRLLEDATADLVVLVRAGDLAPRARATAALLTAADAYGYDAEFLEANLERVSVVEGDLTADLAEVRGIERFWHCAASLRYLPQHRDEIYAVNVEGTRRALDLARRSGAQAFHYVSTAYVAGETSGVIPEERVPAGRTANNVYEQSKIDAEALVLDTTAIPVQVTRPSIIVGHSATQATLSDFGLYGFLAQLHRFRRLLDRAAPGARDATRLTVVADPDTPVNLVPVDLVAAQTVRLASSSARIVHVTNESQPVIRDVFAAIFDAVGLPRPRYTDDPSALTELDLRFDRAIDFYRSYVSGHKVFRQDAAFSLGVALDHPYDSAGLRLLCDRYLGAVVSV